MGMVETIKANFDTENTERASRDTEVTEDIKTSLANTQNTFHFSKTKTTNCTFA